MMLLVLVLGIIVGIAGSIFIKRIFSGKSTKAKVSELQIYSFIENMKSVGELVVFKVFTKEIVTAADHWLGEVGKKYLTWLISKMKMAMIFQFEINYSAASGRSMKRNNTIFYPLTLPLSPGRGD